MTKKIVFFDIDGTIWDWNGVIPQSAITAIKKLKENGHIPVICSGRAKGHIRDERLLSIGFNGIIAACGDHVEYEGKMIFERFLSMDLVKKVIEFSIESQVPIVLEGPVKHWISPTGFEKDEFVTRMYKVMGDDAITLSGFSSDMRVNKFSGDVVTQSDYSYFKSILEKDVCFIEHGLTPDVNQRPDKDLSEIQAVFEAVIPGTSKAEGIKKLCDYLGIGLEDTFAIGDSANDIEMIQCVNTGICMGDGSRSLKEVADYVTTNIRDDGIRKALEHFELI